MSTARYLVAKYVPDMWRMEPRNIGVIVWTSNGVNARFLAEYPERLGIVDGRRIPTYVNNPSAFRQWVAYWRSTIERSRLEPPNGGTPIPREAPEYLDALRMTARGNFLLADGGMTLDEVDQHEIIDLVNQLYTMLVDVNVGVVEEYQDANLESLCDEAIHQAGLQSDPAFRRSYQVHCPIAESTDEVFTFSYAYANGTVRKLYQRVTLPKQAALLRRAIDASAWMFKNVVDHEIVDHDQTLALVRVTDEQRSDRSVIDSLEVLRSVTTVLDVGDRMAAVKEFQSLRDSGIH